VPESHAVATTATDLDAAAHRRLGVDLYNATWALLGTPDRTPSQIDELIHAAHASRFHWALAGDAVGPENLARGEWLCARVYAVLRRAEPALWHARRCVEICTANDIADWDIAAAYEAMARAHLASGDEPAARDWAARAREAARAIAEDDDREVIVGDLDALELG
jgi:hypothetical protein